MNKLVSLFCIFMVLGASYAQQPTKPAVSTDLVCSPCIEFMTNSINDVFKYIVDAGVVGSCGKVCSLLPNQDEAGACDFLCMIVGVKGFMKIFAMEDPDPILMCNELKLCPTASNPNATINVVDVPSSAQQGETITIGMNYDVVTPIGTSQIAVNIQDPKGNVFGGVELLINPSVGPSPFDFQFQATPSKNEPFMPGVYNVQIDICYGTCGSVHKEFKTLATQYANFTLTPGPHTTGSSGTPTGSGSGSGSGSSSGNGYYFY
ncbi:hypothetical protein CYY_005600 [Polysphondylium violaceum]|uniref:Saposin B-type domain-containing protein n=1 Tax=Polysphondylium violaceum TaxID=133409 RepID=A0A8J4PW31_9MYCE|nr:hypothetical protein CYY_005600 [Polysphondylium violaceum]